MVCIVRLPIIRGSFAKTACFQRPWCVPFRPERRCISCALETGIERLHSALAKGGAKGLWSEADADAVAAVVKGAMAGAVLLRVPLDVDVGIGLNWKEAKA